MDHPLFKQHVDLAAKEAADHLLHGARRVTLTVAEWEDDTRVSVFIEPEYEHDHVAAS
jgi:hypothetical protein